jgi:hypothetical protein
VLCVVRVRDGRTGLVCHHEGGTHVEGADGGDEEDVAAHSVHHDGVPGHLHSPVPSVARLRVRFSLARHTRTQLPTAKRVDDSASVPSTAARPMLWVSDRAVPGRYDVEQDRELAH